MDLKKFTQMLEENIEPVISSKYLLLHWYDYKGNWDKAHQIVQDIPDSNAAWIHAYLHRKEGDLSNAGYWYSRAGKKSPKTSLNEEWKILVKHFCENDW